MGIGGIIAGALQGAGEAGVAVGKQWMAEDAATRLRQMEAEIAQARDARQNDLARELQGNQITATKENIGTEITSREGIVGKEIASREGMQEKQIGSTKTLQEAQQTWQGEQNDMQRDLTREQIAAQKAIAGANNATALKVAQIGGTIGQDKDGNVLFYGKDGTAKPIMDPNNPNTPLKGYKDMTPAAKQYAEVIKSQLIGLDKEEIAALDDKTKEGIVQRRAKLNAELLNVLTGGISEAGKSAAAPGKSGWDSNSGQVFKNGEIIGTAKNEAEARKMAATFAPSSAPVVPGRPMYNTEQKELQRIAARPKGVSSAQAAEAQQELDRRIGESRMSGR